MSCIHVYRHSAIFSPLQMKKATTELATELCAALRAQEKAKQEQEAAAHAEALEQAAVALAADVVTAAATEAGSTQAVSGKATDVAAVNEPKQEEGSQPNMDGDGAPPAKAPKTEEGATPVAVVVTEEQAKKAQQQEATAAIDQVYQQQIDDLEHQCADVLQCIHGEVLGIDRCFNRYLLCRGVGGIIVEQCVCLPFAFHLRSICARVICNGARAFDSVSDRRKHPPLLSRT